MQWKLSAVVKKRKEREIDYHKLATTFSLLLWAYSYNVLFNPVSLAEDL